MTIGFLFWLLIILWLIFGVVGRGPLVGDRYWMGNFVFVMILVILLGIKVFGWPIQG